MTEYRLPKIISSRCEGATARRNTVRSLLARAVAAMKPGDWPISVEMELLRLGDKVGQHDVADEVRLDAKELERKKKEIRRQNELGMIDYEGNLKEDE